VPLAAVPAEAQGLLPKLLAAEELARADRFRFARDRAYYISRHAALRLVIARYLGAAPASLLFADEAHGRPVLAHSASGLHFNLSHSGDFALLAVSTSAVGVDIEQTRTIPDLLQVARHHFAPLEVENLSRLARDQQLFGFYTIWTRKEAFVKAIGHGLSYPLDAFSTGRTDQPPLLQVGDMPRKDWTMADLAPAAGYAGALAIGRPDMSTRCLTADWTWLLDGGMALE
jgi:4'-phosphopantetheinyl transferase